LQEFTQLNCSPAASNVRWFGSPYMRNSKRKLRLVKSQEKILKDTKQFRCGDKIPESGIYRVYHRNHRLAHEVTLLRDQLFPKCTKCEDSVYFELVRSAPDITLEPFKVALYALPVNDEEEDFTVAL
jgi:hypothetical protein